MMNPEFKTRWVIRVSRHAEAPGGNAERLERRTAAAYAVVGSLALGFCAWYGFFGPPAVWLHDGRTIDLWEDFLLPLMFAAFLLLSILCWRTVFRLLTREQIRRQRINDRRTTL